MSDTRDTLPTGGEAYPATTSPNVYTTTPGGSTSPAGTGNSSPSSGSGGGVETAKQEAANVAGTAKDEAKHVAQTAKQEVKEVGREARTQISRLYDETRSELSGQASQRQDQVAQGLRSASDELRSMADSSTDGGVATDLVRQAATRLSSAASWLGDRQPADLLDEVKRYARRRPVVFLGVAALAGVVVGRLTRSIAAGEPEPDYTQNRGLTASSRPAAVGGTGSAYVGTGTSTAAYGDTPVYDASSAGLGTGVGTGTVVDAADDVNDPLYGSEGRG